MAATPGGLTASIRRKLHDRKSPDEIVQRSSPAVWAKRPLSDSLIALAEDAAAAPLPPVAETAAPVDELDQFIQTNTAETAAENAKTDAVDGLMGHYDDVDDRVQVCSRNAVTRLDPSVKFPAPGH
jgi:hypothetical protein